MIAGVAYLLLCGWLMEVSKAENTMMSTVDIFKQDPPRPIHSFVDVGNLNASLGQVSSRA